MSKTFSCAIALGSNLGNSSEIVKAALAQLDAMPQIAVAGVSRWYRTKAVGPPQPDYTNGCAILHTDLTPQDLMTVLLNVEKDFGRERREKWGARTLDLDLLLYEDYILHLPNLVVPHPRMCDRAFVMVPLAEIAADWIHPTSGYPISQLAIDCNLPLLTDAETAENTI